MMIQNSGNHVTLTTPNTSLIIKPDSAEYLYYGKKLVTQNNFEYAEICNGVRRIFSDYSGYDYTITSVLVNNPDGGFTSTFKYLSHQILSEKANPEGLPASYGDSQTLELNYIDSPTGLILHLYYTVFNDSDVIAVSSMLENNTDKNFNIKKLASLQLDLNGVDYSITTFEGEWARERQKITRKIDSGIFSNDSKKGMSSHTRNPFIYLEKDKQVYAFNLLYSGNHQESVECADGRKTRVLVGINEFMFDWNLQPHSTFHSPEAIMCFAENTDSMSTEMHAFIRKHIIRGKWQQKERPILVNNWEGTYFNFNEEKILKIAAAAKKVGVELFVLDDGWFGHRNNECSSLGDWYDNVEKTGGGLKNLSDKIRALGLDFGIWVEPEMISEDSDLFRTHPEYALRIPGREPVRHRYQLAIDLTQKEVQDYIIQSVSSVIERCNASYVKWDYNRPLTDCYNKDIAQGEFFHRYMLGLYHILDTITKKFPDVLFEGCAGGGGRFDLGMLCYFPQYWTSDDTDARMRLKIQSGTSFGYPQTTMCAHVSTCPNHQTNDTNPIETRFNVALGGILGFEIDMSSSPEEELKVISTQIEFYKKHRNLLQFGTFYRLGNAFGGNISGFMIVSEDKTQAMASVFVTDRLVHTYDNADYRICLKGLDPGSIYQLETRKQENYLSERSFQAGGDLLMNNGFTLNDIFSDQQAYRASKCLFGRLYMINKI